MTKKIHNHLTKKKLAEAVPSRSLLKINIDAYLDPDDNTIFGYLGFPEEMCHGKHAQSGHIRNVRQLERDSHESLVRLINGREAIKEAKERIVRNELACEHIYKESEEFVETLDQYSLIAEANETATVGEDRYRNSDEFQAYMESELPVLKESIETSKTISNQTYAALVKTFGERELSDRDTVDNDVYTQLTQLEDQFGTWRVPLFAGMLALNIPLVDMSESVRGRTDALLDIRFRDRFDYIFTTLMNEIEAPPILSSDPQLFWDKSTNTYELDNEFLQSFDDIINKLIDSLEIEARPGFEEGSFPLLDLPFQDTPNEYERVNDVYKIIDPDPSPESNMYYDLWRAFGTFGCVIWCSSDWQSNSWVPNTYIAQKSVGNRPYVQLFAENYAAMNIIHQLGTRSFNGKTTPLCCPFCQNEYDHCSNACIQYGNCDTGSIASPEEWEDYLGKMMLVLDDYVATEISGESQLAEYRAARCEAR